MFQLAPNYSKHYLMTAAAISYNLANKVTNKES